MRIKKQNSRTLKFLIRDSEGTTITNLASAVEILFMLKQEPLDTDEEAKIVKRMTLGGVLVDNPEVGYLRVPLTSVDTNIPVFNYYCAVQIQWSATNIQEIEISDNGVLVTQLEIYQDIIRGT